MNRRVRYASFVLLTGCLVLRSGIQAADPVADARAPGLQQADGAIIRGPTSVRRLALVFTGHEFAEGADAILTQLAERRLHGSFFLTGEFLSAPGNRRILERLVREGHFLGPHSDRHLLYCAWEPSKKLLVTRDDFRADLEANLRKIAAFSAPPPRFFLPPYEHANGDIAGWSKELGLTLINYTPGTRSHADYTREQDANFTSSGTILTSILDRERTEPHGLNGYILLMHVGAGPGRADKFHPFLGALLDTLAQRGYGFVRVDQLLAGQEPRPSAAPAAVYVRASQCGYRAGDTKLGILLARDSLPDQFVVRDLRTSRDILRRSIDPMPGATWGAFRHHAELDFSSLRREGRYAIVVGGEMSLPFTVGEGVWRELPDQMLEFMRQQRCGYNPWLHAKCHPLDGRTAYGPLADATPIDVTGGWHDAGDLLKYHMTSGNATAQMLLAWLLASEANGRSPANNDATAWLRDTVDGLGDRGSNGLPDLLDEARWGLEWMLKMHPAPDQLYHQVADDRDHVGFRLPPQDTADYGWGAGGARVVYAADGQPQGLGAYKSEATGVANIAGRYAAAMGLAWQAWHARPDGAAFADRCLAAGREVYELGRAREGFQQGNSVRAPYRYEETTWADDMEWGAAELFRATGEPRYLEDAKRYAELAGSESWMGRDQAAHYRFYPFMNLGHFRLHALVDPPWQSRLAAYYREGLDRCVTAGRSNPYGIGVPFIWCSNNLLTALATQGKLYERMTGERRYRAFIARQRDWLFGRNPWGRSMFTEIGGAFPTDVHLITTRLTQRRIRGGLVDGPVYDRIFSSLRGVSISLPDPLADFQDPRAVYHDDFKDYSTNEPTMDGTASAILLCVIEALAR